MAKRKEAKKSEGVDIDFGIGKLSLGGLFEGVGKLAELAEKLNEAGGEIRKEGEMDLGHLKKGMKGVFGFSVKNLAGGRQVVEPFGNIKKTAAGPRVEEEREPIVDIFNEKEEIRIYAEMPGVNEADIKLEFPPEAGTEPAQKADILTISAQNGDRKYRKEILLPAKVNKETLVSGYKNGILDVRISK